MEVQLIDYKMVFGKQPFHSEILMVQHETIPEDYCQLHKKCSVKLDFAEENGFGSWAREKEVVAERELELDFQRN